ALALRPLGHANWSQSLNNLVNQLSFYFNHQGDDKDLHEATTLHREALAFCLVGHPNWSSLLNNLMNQLSSHFYH
ncbi:hypothetical protein DFJ58DRAFT_671162, partial [Suillus subalutaceus]|uniref:uncharacterized protein n=1 Tax=Suillus subalutaceus TaxID=48586 RepID=UPI001B8804B0